jgi:hypothetical protein
VSASATSRFNRLFSISSSYNRFASLAFMPPYCAIHRCHAALWLLLGDRVLRAVGTTCRSIESPKCEAHQSQTVHLVVVAFHSVGPVVAAGVLAIAATAIGGTANFILALFAAAALLLRGKKRKREPFVAIGLLMGWATVADLMEHAEWARECEEASRIRGEGATRLTITPPFAVVSAVLALDISPWYWFGILFVVMIAAHGFVAMVRAESMYLGPQTEGE